jgi:uncharacterized SAM-binding protein YcdF (DUF218 family)
MRKLLWLFLLGTFLWLCAHSGSYLVIDQPRRADAILVLAGETDRRPARALELRAQGYAPLVIVDVPEARIYNHTQLEVAQEWVNSLPERNAIRLCSTKGLSTRDEAKEAAVCLGQAGAHSVLVVTSDFHTRRALSIFRKELPNDSVSVAAAADSTQFGVRWWEHRQWAKVNLDEWLRLMWWKGIDHWR